MTDPFYDADLATIHHEGFGDFARRAAPGLLRLLRAAEIESGTVVDLGCGSGIWLAAAAQAGFQTAGVDVSEPFVSLARRRVPQAAIRCGSVYGYRIPSCDAVTALGEVVCYLPTNGRAGAPPKV